MRYSSKASSNNQASLGCFNTSADQDELADGLCIDVLQSLPRWSRRAERHCAARVGLLHGGPGVGHKALSVEYHGIEHDESGVSLIAAPSARKRLSRQAAAAAESRLGRFTAATATTVVRYRS